MSIQEYKSDGIHSSSTPNQSKFNDKNIRLGETTELNIPVHLAPLLSKTCGYFRGRRIAVRSASIWASQPMTEESETCGTDGVKIMLPKVS